MTTAQVPSVALSDGAAIPQLGFGVWRVDDVGAENAVGTALDAGYRMIDTASLYKNEAGVGRALRSAADRGIARDDVFITTKLGNPDQGYDTTLRAFDESMDRLGLQVLDLYLIHWPLPERGTFVDTFKAFIRLRDDGRVRSIGVSNFTAEHLDRLIGETGVTPVLNQVELHPRLQQRELRAYHAAHRIITQAWAPIGGGTGLLDDPALAGVAARNGITPAQAVLAWHLARGIVAIPKSVTPSRIKENLAAVTVTLPAAELAVIDALDVPDGAGRTGSHPDEVN